MTRPFLMVVFTTPLARVVTYIGISFAPWASTPTINGLSIAPPTLRWRDPLGGVPARLDYVIGLG